MVRAAPPTWTEHAATLDSRKSDPPPKKGVAARRRTQRLPHSSGTVSAALASASANTTSSALGPAGLIERELIASIRHLHSSARAHGFPRRECFLQPLSAILDSRGGHVQYPGPPTLIGPRESVESRVPSARGAAHNRPATSSRSAGGGCGATGASSGTYTSQPGGLPGSPATRCAGW